MTIQYWLPTNKNIGYQLKFNIGDILKMRKGVKQNKINHIKLNAILENTKAIKNDIQAVAEEKKSIELKNQEVKDKKKEQLQRAQSKFTRVGTKLNEDDFVEFSNKLEYLNMNQSKYIKKLIDYDQVNNVIDISII